MSQPIDRPAPGSHDRSVPSGSMEESSANLFDAMLAARAAEERGEQGPLHAFYRTLMNGTLLLPVPPEHGEEARAALESAINDDEQVEISVMLARESGGETVSVVFGSFAALAAWAPSGSGNLPLPARIAIANLAAAGMPAIMDPAGPVPYRFGPDELAALSEGRLPGSDSRSTSRRLDPPSGFDRPAPIPATSSIGWPESSIQPALRRRTSSRRTLATAIAA